MAGTQSTGGDMLLYFLSIILPPIGPFAKVGCGAAFWISIALTILGWIPGVIYAWYIISKYGRERVRY
ncbi:hypothetical protein NliqN6_1298 [Naganishia liquefaciens]|uniref:YqaE/Pmp3 family membrane protein n=1 Tax=Naganishia liquefaciens TaxID=104408 RepID=A0A8H3YEM4_9TREE|nr:hypothetical protein NliqN6_1298 [Naganishia liquefaciens]